MLIIGRENPHGLTDAYHMWQDKIAHLPYATSVTTVTYLLAEWLTNAEKVLQKLDNHSIPRIDDLPSN